MAAPSLPGETVEERRHAIGSSTLWYSPRVTAIEPEERCAGNAPVGRLNRSAPTGLTQDPRDLADRNPEDLGNLRDGHAVLHPDAYPGNL